MRSFRYLVLTLDLEHGALDKLVKIKLAGQVSISGGLQLNVAKVGILVLELELRDHTTLDLVGEGPRLKSKYNIVRFSNRASPR